MLLRRLGERLAADMTIETTNTTSEGCKSDDRSDSEKIKHGISLGNCLSNMSTVKLITEPSYPAIFHNIYRYYSCGGQEVEVEWERERDPGDGRMARERGRHETHEYKQGQQDLEPFGTTSDYRGGIIDNGNLTTDRQQ